MFLTLCERIGQLVAYLVAHHPADADPAWLCERLQPGGYVNAIPVDIVISDDHVAKVDPDPEGSRAVSRERSTWSS